MGEDYRGPARIFSPRVGECWECWLAGKITFVSPRLASGQYRADQKRSYTKAK